VISKAAILERAGEWQLTAEVVEKDYVLGWLLAGVAQHPATTNNWVFKGGTCLKKCVLETYRFSEDLDFTLLPIADYSSAGIEAILREIMHQVTALSGIQFPGAGWTVKERKDQAGRPTLEIRVAYSGPLVFPGTPKIRFDLTQHEPVLRSPERRPVFHPYPDELPPRLQVTTYSTSELVAEKTRALCERMRPRDLYDVVMLGVMQRSEDGVRALRSVAAEKFAVKGMTLPSVSDVVTRAAADEELRSEWENMLGHQLPATPPLDDFLARLADAIAWMHEPPATAAPGTPVTAASPRRPLSPVPSKSGESLVVEPGIRTWGVGAPLEAIRYAGASHLLVEFRYHDAVRRVEPYSLRRPRTGSLLLYGFEQLKNGFSTNDIRAYNIAKIDQVRILSSSFVPRYSIELTEQAGVWRW
jgi:predicted nucleotidyltransferase component of viral defense system